MEAANSTRFLETVFIKNIKDLENRHELTKKLVTNPSFLESTLQRVKNDANTIGIYPANPALIQKYVNFIANNGEKPDKIYLAASALYFDTISSKRLDEGACHGLTLSRIHWDRSIGIPTFYFITQMNSTYVGIWKEIPHADPGFIASTDLMSKLISRHPDILNYEGVICPFFLTKSYLEDSRVSASFLKVRINGEDHYLYGDKTLEVYRNKD